MLTVDQGSVNVLIPLDLGLTINGLSGLNVGNVITTDILPTAYKNDAWFQIVGINDIIDPTGWKTEISTGFRKLARKPSTTFPITADSQTQILDKQVADNIYTQGNPDDLQNSCFGKYKISDLNMNKFGTTNTITSDVKQNLIYLCKEFLQPLNVILQTQNINLSVVSAFRSNDINSRYDEPIDNLHTFGCAADLKARNNKTGKYLMPSELAQIIWISKLKYDILVTEDYWLHISYVNEGAAGRSNRMLNYQVSLNNINHTRNIVQI